MRPTHNNVTRAADVNSEGNYRCEIVSEAPDFETVRKGKHLKIYGKFRELKSCPKLLFAQTNISKLDVDNKPLGIGG